MKHTRGVKVTVIDGTWHAIYDEIHVEGDSLTDAMEKYDAARKAEGKSVIR